MSALPRPLEPEEPPRREAGQLLEFPAPLTTHESLADWYEHGQRVLGGASPLALAEEGGYCAPLSVMGFTLEDLDATPVPSGCGDCYQAGGGRCMTCPDKSKPMRKQARP